ncbi:hypothetical protein XENORESO_009702 [Xenotaenia resolanae]|uniref:Uncharacterized protein n=1 Tax=Xenotaenia resolanae TaxID=208358 RepID=A0ABV0W9G0_9TELE
MRFKLFNGREEAAWTTLPEHVDPGSRIRSGSERNSGTIVDLERLLLLVPPIYTSTNEPPAPRKVSSNANFLDLNDLRTETELWIGGRSLFHKGDTSSFSVVED